MTDRPVIISHEMFDDDLERFRADAATLLKTAEEVCPTICMPSCEHPLRGGMRVIRNPAVSDISIEVSGHSEHPTGGIAFLDVLMHGRSAFFRIPTRSESIEASVFDLPRFVLERAREIDQIARTTTYEDDGYRHLDDVAGLSWILGGEASSIILPTPWSGARLAPWDVPPNIDDDLARMIRDRVGERVEISSTPNSADGQRYEIAFERIEARDPGIAESMRIAARWSVALPTIK